MRIRDTALYKALREIPDLGLTAKQLEKELGVARKSYANGNWGLSDLSAGFVWHETPQGHKFWRDIHNKQVAHKGRA